MAETKPVKIEIPYDEYAENHTFRSPPRHYTELSFWGSEVAFPYVVEIPADEAERISKAFEEYRWAQNRLSQLTRSPRPQKCMCGNCPDEGGGAR